MADFKRVLEGLGFSDVKTLLNSGNAVATKASGSASGLSAAIAAAIREQLGVETPVIVKSASELSAILKGVPFVPAAAEHSRVLVAFGPDAQALQSLIPLEALLVPPEQFAVTDRAAYLHCPQGLLESKLGAALLGKAGRQVTTRNWATVEKLAALIGAPAA
jgi:uncharacterized protein (DUF1697 family)